MASSSARIAVDMDRPRPAVGVPTASCNVLRAQVHRLAAAQETPARPVQRVIREERKTLAAATYPHGSNRIRRAPEADGPIREKKSHEPV